MFAEPAQKRLFGVNGGLQDPQVWQLKQVNRYSEIHYVKALPNAINLGNAPGPRKNSTNANEPLFSDP